MHPNPYPWFYTSCTLSLRDFVGMVNRNMVYTSAVDIELHTQIFHAHSTTFYMPTWKTFPPRAIPLHILIAVL